MGTEGKNLSSMTRDELNAHATECGVYDPESYATKDDLVVAIEGLSVPQDETLAEPMAAPAPEGETEAAPPDRTDEGAA